MHEAKTELSKLVEAAQRGEDILIARAGTPVVRLTPIPVNGVRALGQWKGKVKMRKDFDAPLPEEMLKAWEATEPEDA